MNITVRKYEEKDLPDLIRIWNEVVEDGVAFPQEECLNEETGKAFFAEQTYTAAAVDEANKRSSSNFTISPFSFSKPEKRRLCRNSRTLSSESTSSPDNNLWKASVTEKLLSPSISSTMDCRSVSSS